MAPGDRPISADMRQCRRLGTAKLRFLRAMGGTERRFRCAALRLPPDSTCQPGETQPKDSPLLKLKFILPSAIAAFFYLSVAPVALAHDGGTSAGMASWYGPGFHGRQTANGETFNMNELTAAHRSLPFGTKVRVTNEATNNSVVVRINDRGPFAHNRVIDLSKEAAEDIGILAAGVGRVKIEVL